MRLTLVHSLHTTLSLEAEVPLLKLLILFDLQYETNSMKLRETDKQRSSHLRSWNHQMVLVWWWHFNYMNDLNTTQNCTVCDWTACMCEGTCVLCCAAQPGRQSEWRRCLVTPWTPGSPGSQPPPQHRAPHSGWRLLAALCHLVGKLTGKPKKKGFCFVILYVNPDVLD